MPSERRDEFAVSAPMTLIRQRCFVDAARPGAGNRPTCQRLARTCYENAEPMTDAMIEARHGGDPWRTAAT